MYNAMLFRSLLKQYDDKVKKGVEKLYKKAFDCQSDPNDLFLILVHGHYDKLLDESNTEAKVKLSPYVFGPGNEGMVQHHQYLYYDYFRNQIVKKEPVTYWEEKKKKSEADHDYERDLTIQIQMTVYLKFWESELILKSLYNLCRLIHGEPYNWYKEMNSSRKNLIETEIKDKARRLVPKFYELIDKLYIRQLRNAIAHSQFFILGNNIMLTNKDEDADMNLSSISFEKWDEIYHKTILFYNHILGCEKFYDNYYRDQAYKKHYGLKIRIKRLEGIEKTAWIRLLDSENKDSQWVWHDK